MPLLRSLSDRQQQEDKQQAEPEYLYIELLRVYVHRVSELTAAGKRLVSFISFKSVQRWVIFVPLVWNVLGLCNEVLSRTFGFFPDTSESILHVYV